MKIKSKFEMINPNSYNIRVLQVKLEALEILNQAYKVKIEGLQSLISQVRASINEVDHNIESQKEIEPTEIHHSKHNLPKRKRGRPRKKKTVAIKKSNVQGKDLLPSEIDLEPDVISWQTPVENWLLKNLPKYEYTRLTIKGLTGFLLCLFDKGSASAPALLEYIGGSQTSLNRYATALKKMNLIIFLGAPSKGRYVLTNKGRALYMQIVRP